MQLTAGVFTQQRGKVHTLCWDERLLVLLAKALLAERTQNTLATV